MRGQKQQLLIACALLSRLKILFLDEATSALDNKSQNEIIHHHGQLNITWVVIAHQLNTIRNASRICVIKNGSVTQSGTFDSLVQEMGRLAEILKR